MRTEKLALKGMMRNILEESRMVLPGVQALFGFQLIAVFNSGFGELDVFDKEVHLIALLLNILAIGCLMAPASYHRQVERDSVSDHLVKFSSQLLCIGLIPLVMSLSLDAYVVCKAITDSTHHGIVAGLFSFSFLTLLWYAVPQIERKKRKARQEENHKVLSDIFEVQSN
jgi:hypothetical protein